MRSLLYIDVYYASTQGDVEITRSTWSTQSYLDPWLTCSCSDCTGTCTCSWCHSCDSGSPWVALGGPAWPCWRTVSRRVHGRLVRHWLARWRHGTFRGPGCPSGGLVRKGPEKRQDYYREKTMWGTEKCCQDRTKQQLSTACVGLPAESQTFSESSMRA